MNLLIIGDNINDYLKDELINRGHNIIVASSYCFSYLIKDGTLCVYAAGHNITKDEHDAYIITEAHVENLNRIKSIIYALNIIGIPCISSTLEAGLACKDKTLISLIANYTGIRVPNQSCIQSPEFCLSTIQQLKFPLVFKEIDRSVGNGIIFVDNVYTLLSMYEMIYGKDLGMKSYSIQEFINGNFQDERYIVCDGKIINSMRRTASKYDFRANTGRGGSGEPIKIEDIDDETKNMVISIVNNIEGLYYAGVDIIRENSIPYLIEVNFWPGNKIIEITGKNHFVEYVDFLEKRYSEIQNNK